MTQWAYLKLLERARCTVNFCSPNCFDGSLGLTVQEQVEFLFSRLRQFGVRGYSRAYIRQLVAEADPDPDG